jgi:hypothetical protein
MSKTFQQWMAEGQELYAMALQDFQALEAQLANLEASLTAKQDEVNQIAQMIGKSPVEGGRHLTAQLIERDRDPAPSSPAAIARALTGRNLGR